MIHSSVLTVSKQLTLIANLIEIMPQIMENGTRDMQLQAHMLMGKILLKMG